MLTRWSSFRALTVLEPFRPPACVNPIYLHQIPKNYITSSTVDDGAPKAKKASPPKKERKKESFKEQLYKKNKERVKKLALEFVHLVVHGSKSAYKDSKYICNVVSSKPKRGYTIEEIRENQRIVRDLMKFIPFYAAILIPAGELVLPIYLFLFPRAIPSYYSTEQALKEMRYKYIDQQARAHKHLKTYLLSAMIHCGFDPSVKDPDAMKKFFIARKERLLPMLKLGDMDSEHLRHANDFIMYEYVEGTYILNLLYKTIVNFPRYMINAAMWVARKPYRAIWNHIIFNYTFRMNFFPFEPIKKMVLKYQLKKQLKVMKAQNYAIILNQFGKLEDETVLDVARERGHYADKEEDARKWLKEDWTKIAKDNVENELFLFWYSVIVYEHFS